eukprot:1497005-Pleurochrysis_carterae.AAC.1
MTGDGEGGAGRRGYDGGVLSCGAALKEPLVYGVSEEIVLLTPPVSSVRIDGVALEAGTREEGGDAVG